MNGTGIATRCGATTIIANEAVGESRTRHLKQGHRQKNEGVGEHVRVEVHRGEAACDCGDAISTP
jgi:hypothetical protein